jgi:hypothetical protein
MDPRAGLDDVEKRNSWPYRDLNSDPSVQPIASRYTDYTIPAPTSDLCACTDFTLKFRLNMLELTFCWTRLHFFNSHLLSCLAQNQGLNQLSTQISKWMKTFWNENKIVSHEIFQLRLCVVCQSNEIINMWHNMELVCCKFREHWWLNSSATVYSCQALPFIFCPSPRCIPGY